jgi:diaminohydroxyphosphoribosylaminopyrimidine deaminase / 5-amino-6-(5-phosphoribosylamino)uracil reductase
MNETDRFWMQQALNLAQRGLYGAHPNPLVGAVIVNAKGHAIGEGWHAQYGGDHAEVVALKQAGQNAKGATLYVTLEPCHHHGHTPPCDAAVMAAGLKRVVVATLDPNPKVSGEGVKALQAAGITVDVGCLSAEAERLNAAFLHTMRTQTPYVALKLANSIDGKLAVRGGKSGWLTGELARAYVHTLRGQFDAILTTRKTVQADNPTLNVRVDGFEALGGRQPLRVVLARNLMETPETYTVFQPNTGGKPLVITADRALKANDERVKHHHALGIALEGVPETSTGLDLDAVMQRLWARGVRSVWVESGGILASSLLKASLIHRFYQLQSGHIFADSAAIPAFSGEILHQITAARQFKLAHVQRLGDDVLMEWTP